MSGNLNGHNGRYGSGLHTMPRRNRPDMEATTILPALRGTIELAQHLVDLGVHDVRPSHAQPLTELIREARDVLAAATATPDLDELRICVRSTLRISARVSQNLIQHLRLNELHSIVRLDISAMGRHG